MQQIRIMISVLVIISEAVVRVLNIHSLLSAITVVVGAWVCIQALLQKIPIESKRKDFDIIQVA